MNSVLLKTLHNKNVQALSLLELVIAVAMISVIFIAGFQVFHLALRTVDRAKEYTIAEQLTHDLIELTVAKRNEDWNSLIPGEYYFVEDIDPDVGFVFTAGQETIDQFTRSVTIEAVTRDVSGNMASSGTVDDNTMKVIAVTTWTNKGLNFDVTFEQYLTNWRRF